MEILITGLILWCLLSWFFKSSTYVFYWTFNPISEWARERIDESRYQRPDSSIVIYMIARLVDINAYLLIWIQRTARDHFGTYLLSSFLLSVLWYITAVSSSKGIYEYLFLALLTILLTPTFFLSKFSEPLGLVRCSYFLGQLATYSYRHYHDSGSLFSASIAWRRMRNNQQKAKQKKWLLAKLLRCNQKDISTQVCYFLLSDTYYSKEQLVALLQALYFIDPIRCPGRLYRKAGLLLLAIECQRGNWGAVRKWSALWIKKAPSPSILFFNLVAQRMDYKPVPGNYLLLCLTCIFCLNPNYITIAFLALKKKPHDFADVWDSMDTSKPDRQIGLQVLSEVADKTHLKRNKAILHRLGCYFERILDMEQNKPATNRDTKHYLNNIEDVLTSTLSSWYENADQNTIALEQSRLITSTSSDQENKLMESIDYQAKSLKNRFNQGKYITTTFEWQEWASIMILYEQTTVIPHLHYIAFHKLSGICWSWSAWLHNTQSDRTLSYAIFSWIRQEALHFQDYHTANFMDKNLRTS